jgi:hypothetical protein
MKKLLLGSLFTLASFNTFAQTAVNIEGLRCNVSALKENHEEVKSEIRDLMIQMKVEVMKELAHLKLQFNADDIVINKREMSFTNNYASEVTGTATLSDGVVINIKGLIQYNQISFEKKYDRLGRDIGRICEFRGTSTVLLFNGQTNKVISSIRNLRVGLDLKK